MTSTVHMCRGKELGGKEGGPQRELGHLHVCVHCKYVRTYRTCVCVSMLSLCSI